MRLFSDYEMEAPSVPSCAALTYFCPPNVQEIVSLPDVEPAILLDSEPRSFRMAAWAILCLAALLFAIQLETLYVFPIPDSVRWGGDETWLMREFGSQATHGVMSYPEIFDGQTRTDGVLAGSMWVEAVVYGAIGAQYFPAHSLVDIGRTVTAMLALMVLIVVYWACRRLGVSRLLSSLAVLLACSTQAFVFAVHCARYDILTGLSLLGFLLILTRLDRSRTVGSSLFAAGVLSATCIIFSRHLLTLTIGVTILWLFRQRIWDSAKRLAVFVSGALLGLAALAAAYVAGSGEFSLFGGGGGFGSYGFVLQQLPVLRPFSRSVQVSNLLERYNLFTQEAPGFLLIALTAAMLVAAYLILKIATRAIKRNVRVNALRPQAFFVLASGLATASWLLLQGARPYYAMHIVPLVVVASMIVFEWLHETFELAPLLRYPVPALTLLVALIQLPGSLPKRDVGDAIVRDQRAALRALVDRTQPHSRIVCDVAGLNWALMDTGRQVLTLDMFQPPASEDQLIAKLSRARIDYLIFRSSPVGTPFEPGRASLPLNLSHRGICIDSVLGFFYDDGRDYTTGIDSMIHQGLDTLRLYKVSSARP